MHFVYFDTGSIPVVIGLTNITAGPDSKRDPKHPGPGSGYIAYCEGGRFEGQRGGGAAFDKDGKLIKKFSGNSGDGLHQKNFIEAVRKRDASILNAPVEIGHDSTGWCNLANIAYRAGSEFSREAVQQVRAGSDIWGGLIGDMHELLATYDIDMESSAIKLSPLLELDAETEQFVGEHADVANRFLKREYRKPFVVPEITS